MSTAPLEQAISSAKAVLAAVKPSDLDKTSPCASWKVSELINHFIGAHYWFASVAKGDADDGDPPDFAAGDFNAAFAQGAAASVAAFNAPGVMEKSLKLPWGEMMGSQFAGLAAVETLTHAWDVAHATGQSTDLAPELAAMLLVGARAGVPDEFRGTDKDSAFGPEQQAPAGATNADKLAAFLGRTV